MDNLSAHDFNDLQGLCLEGFEMSEARGLKNADLFDVAHGIQDPSALTVSKTVLINPTASVEASDTNALQKQDSITTTKLLISSNLTKGKAAATPTSKHHKRFAMTSKTVRSSGRTDATLFNNESSEMRQAGLRHLEHKQVVISIAR